MAPSNNNYTPNFLSGWLNGRPVINVSNSGDLVSAALLPVLTNATIYMVARQKSGGADPSNGVFISAPRQILKIRRNGSGQSITATASNTAGETVSAAVNDDIFYTIRLRLTETNMYLSINNAAETTHVRTPGTLVPSILQLFKEGNTQGGKMLAELLIYTASHDSTCIKL